MRLMVTGGRDWDDHDTIEEAFRTVNADHVILMHGDCRGADSICAYLAKWVFDWQVMPYPADWKKYGHSAGPRRNQEMVDMEPDFCFAFPTCPKGTKGSGTWDAVWRARAAQIPTIVFGPHKDAE